MRWSLVLTPKVSFIHYYVLLQVKTFGISVQVFSNTAAAERTVGSIHTIVSCSVCRCCLNSFANVTYFLFYCYVKFYWLKLIIILLLISPSSSSSVTVLSFAPVTVSPSLFTVIPALLRLQMLSFFRFISVSTSLSPFISRLALIFLPSCHQVSIN